MRLPHPQVDALAALIGEWEMEVPQFPEFRGRASVEWIYDGAYLAIRDAVAAGEFPSGTWIIGGDEAGDVSTALYHDSRGERRVYQTSLANRVWRIWRHAPGFNQRFTGRLGPDARTISGRWEMSAEGAEWQTDFDLLYRKVS